VSNIARIVHSKAFRRACSHLFIARRSLVGRRFAFDSEVGIACVRGLCDDGPFMPNKYRSFRDVADPTDEAGVSSALETLFMDNGFKSPSARLDDLSPEARALLAERAHGGRSFAENDVVRLFQRRVLAMMLCRVRDAEAARDLTQEVLMAVMLALRKDRIQGDGNLAAYVYGTARNVVDGFMRSQPPSHLPPSQDVTVGDADGILESLHVRSMMSRLLMSLNAADREVLELALIEGLKPWEIARRLGLTSETVRARKSRAIKKAIAYVREASRTA
jgi:RNA polymerase sigma factor (sigma-70 family)